MKLLPGIAARRLRSVDGPRAGLIAAAHAAMRAAAVRLDWREAWPQATRAILLSGRRPRQMTMKEREALLAKVESLVAAAHAPQLAEEAR